MKKIFLRLVAIFLTAAVIIGFSTADAKSLTLEKIISITSAAKGERPEPSTYLSKRYIAGHLKKFRAGVSIVMGLESYKKYVVPAEKIGRADGCFVMPKYICDALEKKFADDLSGYEKSLSFSEGYFSAQGGLVRLDVFEFDDLNLRLPSGNETGANSQWLPGGFTMGGIPEAVVDMIPKGRAKIKFIGCEPI